MVSEIQVNIASKEIHIIIASNKVKIVSILFFNHSQKNLRNNPKITKYETEIHRSKYA